MVLDALQLARPRCSAGPASTCSSCSAASSLGPPGPQEQARTGRFDGRRFTARRLLQALAGALRLPRRPGARRPRAVDVLPLAERPPRAELRGDVADPPVVARGRGALLPRAGRALPAVRPPPRLRRACSPAILVGVLVGRPGPAGLGAAARRQRRAAAVAHALPGRLARRRRPARASCSVHWPGAFDRLAAARWLLGGGHRRRHRVPRHRRQARPRSAARRLHGRLPDRRGVPAAPATAPPGCRAPAGSPRRGRARPLLLRHLHLARLRRAAGARARCRAWTTSRTAPPRSWPSTGRRSGSGCSPPCSSSSPVAAAPRPAGPRRSPAARRGDDPPSGGCRSRRPASGRRAQFRDRVPSGRAPPPTTARRPRPAGRSARPAG